MAHEGGPAQRVAVAGVVVGAECLLAPGWHEYHALEDPSVRLAVADEGRDFVEWAAGAFGAGRVAVVSTMFPSGQIRHSLIDAADKEGKARILWKGHFSDQVIGVDDLKLVNPDAQSWCTFAFRVAAIRMALKPDALAAVDGDLRRLIAADDYGFGVCCGIRLGSNLPGVTHSVISLAEAQRELIEFTGQ